MNHFLDKLFGYDLGNPIEDSKKANINHVLDALRVHPACKNLIKEMRSYKYKPINSDFIEGECTVIEIDDKKLLGDF